MPEGVQGYPRWDGELSTGPAFPVIAAQEVRRMWDNAWGRPLVLVILVYTVMVIGSQWTRSGGGHTLDAFLPFLYLLPWGALGIAAVMTGPSLLGDAKSGALELYLSRAVTRSDYMAGKVLAMVGITTASILVPALLYHGSSYLFFEEHPEGWALVPLGILAFALMWGVMISGLAMGLSAISRSSRAATLILVGGLAVLHAIMTNLLEALTKSTEWNLISPFYAMQQQSEWMFQTTAEYGFPTWWGLVAWGALSVIGWGLVWWKHPRIRGEERGGS